MKGLLPRACPKHPHTPLPKGNNKCPNCEGERLAERDRKSTSRVPWAPFQEAVRGRSNVRDKGTRVGEVEARHRSRHS